MRILNLIFKNILNSQSEFGMRLKFQSLSYTFGDCMHNYIEVSKPYLFYIYLLIYIYIYICI